MSDKIKLCKYGCGNEAIFTLKNGAETCSSHSNKCPAIKSKNSKAIKDLYATGVKTCVFNDIHRKTSKTVRKNKLHESFINGNVNYPNDTLKRLLIETGTPSKCSICSLTKWQEKEIILELDHIDGNSTNNTPANLRLLCPNCHSQTGNFRGRNINTGKIKVSDEDLIKAFKEHGNIRQCLLAVGLAPKGGNYFRVKKLVS